METFDHLFTTRYGDLDIVPFPYGPHGKEDCFTFASLDARAETFAAFGQQIRVAHLDDVIASKLSARREKDLRLLAFDRAITATLRARRSERLASDGLITEAKATPRLICTYGLGTNSVFHSEQVGYLYWQFNELSFTR